MHSCALGCFPQWDSLDIHNYNHRDDSGGTGYRYINVYSFLDNPQQRHTIEE